jgi:hypothetical protein
VEVTRHARDLSQTAAQNDLNRFNITLTQNGNTVNTIATGDWHTSVSQELTADLLITVPSASNLDLTLQAGTMTVNDITGALAATVNAGTLITRNVTLNSVSRINVITGQATVDAALTNSAPLDVSVTTGTASLTLPMDTAAHLDARVTVGDISVSGWSLAVMRQGPEATASGDLNANPKSAITVRVTTGSIRLSSR